MIEIDKSQVVTWLGEIVAEMGPGIKYQDLKTAAGYSNASSCYYVHRIPGDVVDTFEPGCIVGQVVIKKMGISAEEIYGAGIDGSDDDGEYSSTGLPVNGTSAREFVEWLESNYEVRFTSEAILALRIAQRRQDGGVPWGEAIEDL